MPFVRIPQVRPGKRADSHRRIERVADRQGSERGREPFDEAIRQRVRHEEALRRDAALSIVLGAGADRCVDHRVQVCVLEDKEGIAAAELEHGRLEVLPRERRHGSARSLASGQGGRLDDRGGHQLLEEVGRIDRHEEALEDARGESSFATKLFERRGAARHVRRVLEQDDVAGE